MCTAAHADRDDRSQKKKNQAKGRENAGVPDVRRSEDW